MMKSAFRTCCLALAMLAVASAAAADTYPSKPIRLIVPYAAGTGVDSMGRHVATGLTKDLGQTVIVENKPGANGMIGTELVAKSPPDGYVLLMAGSATHSSANALYKSVPYNVETDFQPISNFIDADFFLVVRNESPIKSVADLNAFVKANPGKASFGFGSTTTEVAGLTYLKLIGGQAVAVPYKGNSVALNDLLGGQIDFMWVDQTVGLPQLAGGKIRALAVASKQRRADLPNVPTTHEQGLDMSVNAWIGLMAPAGIPADVKDKLVKAAANLLRDPEVRQKMAASGRVSDPMTPEQYIAYLKSERNSWETKIRSAGIQPQ